MIPRLNRREQLELNQNTEPNLNLTPQISFSGVEGKLDLLWLSASLASSWTGSPLSNLSHVLGVTPSWWHKQEWAQSERLCPPRWQRSELARVHRGLASLARCQKCRSSTQKKNHQTSKPSPGCEGFAKLFREKHVGRPEMKAPRGCGMEGTTSYAHPSPVPKSSHPKRAKLFSTAGSSALRFGLHKSKRQRWQSKLDTGPSQIQTIPELWDARIWVRPICTQFIVSLS